MQFTVEAEQEGERLDVFLSERMPQHSRVQIRRAITAGHVQVDGKSAKPAYRLKTDQRIEIEVPEVPREGPEPEDIPLDILYEDAALAAVNKPAGMVVHPAKGHWSGTLTAALAFHFQHLSHVGGPTRPGIVHRLDRDTSGVIVVAKTDPAHYALAAQFEQRTVEKQYWALVAGVPDRDRDVVEKPIGAHPYQREKMAIRADHATSRDARSFYEVLERFSRFALVQVQPKTGRTHQIRVHLAHIGCPVLCDRLYGGRSQVTAAELTGGASEEVVLDRQALHARRLSLTHPDTGQPLTFEAPLPADFARTLEMLRSGA